LRLYPQPLSCRVHGFGNRNLGSRSGHGELELAVKVKTLQSHSGTEPPMIFVLSGEMAIGRRGCGAQGGRTGFGRGSVIPVVASMGAQANWRTPGWMISQVLVESTAMAMHGRMSG